MNNFIFGSAKLPDSRAGRTIRISTVRDKAFMLGKESLLGTTPENELEAQEMIAGLSDEALRRCTDFLSASCELRLAIKRSPESLLKMLHSQMGLCRGCLLLAKRKVPPEQRKKLLDRAAQAIETAFRAHEHSREARPKPPEAAMLQVLQFEVGVLRDDPNTRVWLQRAVETEGVTAEYIDWMGVICLEQHNPELGRLAFETALTQRRAASPKDYNKIAWLLRQLISTCTHHTRHEAKRYFEIARDELERFSSDNCPMSEDELQWLASHSWNRGVGFFIERQLEVAEGWINSKYPLPTVRRSPIFSE